MQYPFLRDLFAEQPKPLAFLDLDRLKANAEALVQRAGQKRLRIATKSVRCRAVLERIQAQSDRIQGFMTFSPQETAFLAAHGFDDFLLAYPAVYPQDLKALCDVAHADKTVRAMVDMPEHVERAQAAAAEAGVSLKLCLDLDMSSHFPGLFFGARRSSIATPSQALALAELIDQHPNVELDALMGYEAQIAGVGDATPGQGAKNLVIRWLKNRSAREIQKRRADTVNALKDKGRELSVINGGGTGSLEWTRQETSVTEVTAGSGFFHPSLFDNYTNFQHQPAAGFAIEITRKPAAGIYTCAGGGYIASGAPGPDKAPKPWLPEGAELLANEGAGEVQTPVYYDGKEQLRLGDPIFLRHAKAGELCERFQELHLLSEGRLLDTVPTYRGEGQCFL